MSGIDTKYHRLRPHQFRSASQQERVLAKIWPDGRIATYTGYNAHFSRFLDKNAGNKPILDFFLATEGLDTQQGRQSQSFRLPKVTRP